MDPMPIEKLPEFLRNNKNVGEVGPLVDVGRIVVPQRSYMKWAAALTMVMVLGIGGMATYNAMSTREMTVVVDVNQGVPSQALAKMMSEIGGEVIAVKQTQDSTYEIKVATRKSKTSFLEWLRKNKDVKKATELKD